MYYENHRVKKNQSVTLTLSFDYDQLPNAIELLQALGVSISCAISFVADKPEIKKLGSISVDTIKIKHDGSGIIQFESMTPFLELDILNELSKHEDELISLYCKYTLEN